MELGRPDQTGQGRPGTRPRRPRGIVGRPRTGTRGPMAPRTEIPAWPGGPQDSVQAYLWLSLATAHLPAVPLREQAVRASRQAAQKMTPAQWTRAQAWSASGRLRRLPSAESSDLFWHDQMCLSFTAIVGIDPCFEFVRTQQPVRFRHGPLAMDPFRLNGVEPRTFAGQVADHETHPDCPCLTR